jgi:hypothetical protein
VSQPIPQVIQQVGIQQSALDDMEMKIMDKIAKNIQDLKKEQDNLALVYKEQAV